MIILRLLRKLATAEALGMILVLVALQIFIYGVSESLRNTDTNYFFHVCILALLIGLGLGKRNLNPILASALMVALGLAGIWILAARLAAPLLDLLRAAIAMLPLLIPAIRSTTITLLDTSAIVETWIVIRDASTILILRLQTWLAGLNRNVSVNDTLIRNMIWLFLLWLVAAWTGWFTARRNAILALLPCIALLAAVTSYSEFKIETLWMLVFVTLLLMGVWNYKNHMQQWETRKVDYSESIRYDNTQAVLFLAIAMGSVAIVTPSISWREIRDYFRERNRTSENQTADILGIQEQRAPTKNVPMQKPELPRDHLLTGGYAQSEKIVMTIRIGELPPTVSVDFTSNAPRYYWRSAIYDEYVGAGWVTSSAPSQKYQPDTPLIPGLLNGYKLLHLDINMQQPEGRLFWSGTLFSADIPLTVDWRVRPQADLFADQAALLKADIFVAATNATAFKVESYVPTVSLQQLRSASSEYPENIRGPYLSFPPSVPERVLQLAEKITAGKANSYDKVKAIETYLRTNFPYDLEVSAPPPGRDVAD